MFEDRTYEALVKRALARVPPTMDKREGSMAFNGVAPSMAEVAQLYIGLDFVFRATYLLTAPREYLIKRASDRNMAPYPASAAVYRAEFNREVPEGTRFSCEDANFVVTGRMASEDDTETGLSHRVACETVGAAANHYAGQLIPVEYMEGLTRAELVELLIPGDDEEETEKFRRRVLDSFQSQAFGGNQADYKEKVLAIPGVGDVKIYPVWNKNLRPASMIPSEEVTAWFEAVLTTLDPAVAAWLAAVYTAAKDRLLT
ncbi:MAG: baseplate J/gp47 family protein, partial [Oscillospiraceae bacterium]|nr:baseplate J/gp47 family protein [Oscillospiraceae bacterium]